MERVVKIIVPLRVQSVSSQFPRADQARVVKVAFGNEIDLTVEAFSMLLNREGQLFEKRLR
jgi:hypothetical protein